VTAADFAAATASRTLAGRKGSSSEEMQSVGVPIFPTNPRELDLR
jgi:hypothetical protein